LVHGVQQSSRVSGSSIRATIVKVIAGSEAICLARRSACRRFLMVSSTLPVAEALARRRLILLAAAHTHCQPRWHRAAAGRSSRGQALCVECAVVDCHISINGLPRICPKADGHDRLLVAEMRPPSDAR